MRDSGFANQCGVTSPCNQLGLSTTYIMTLPCPFGTTVLWSSSTNSEDSTLTFTILQTCATLTNTFYGSTHVSSSTRTVCLTIFFNFLPVTEQVSIWRRRKVRQRISYERIGWHLFQNFETKLIIFTLIILMQELVWFSSVKGINEVIVEKWCKR